MSRARLLVTENVWSTVSIEKHEAAYLKRHSITLHTQQVMHCRLQLLFALIKAKSAEARYDLTNNMASCVCACVCVGKGGGGVVKPESITTRPRLVSGGGGGGGGGGAAPPPPTQQNPPPPRPRPPPPPPPPPPHHHHHQPMHTRMHLVHLALSL
jgi:hypothetical protein